MLYYNKIRELCNENNIILKKLSEEIDISEHGLQAMFRNDTMQIKLLFKIAERFNVNILYFFDENYQIPENNIDKVFEILQEMVKEKLNSKKQGEGGKKP